MFKRMARMARLAAVLGIAIGFAGAIGSSPALGADADDPPVMLRDDGSHFTLSNAYVTAQIDEVSGDLTSLRYKGLELMGFVSGHHAGYWEQSPAGASHFAVTRTIDPFKNGGERAEVSIKGFSDGTATVAGLCDLDIRYTLGRHDHGIYTYAIFSHGATYPATSIGESRWGAKLSGDVFDWFSIDAKRNRLMPSGFDWDHGTPTNMKEARRMTTGVYKGQVEHKYDYCGYQFDTPAYGWASTKFHVGLYFINPSTEFLSGGATKYELTGHLDDGEGGDPTLLDYWRGTHYGGSECSIAANEKWSKVVGPILVYVNTAATPNDNFQDALAQAKKEADAWPYDWVQGVDYPHKDQRGTVSGQLVLNDPQLGTSKLTNLLVGLAYPDAIPSAGGSSAVAAAPAPAAGGRGRGGRAGGRGAAGPRGGGSGPAVGGGGRAVAGGMTWQNDAKHYQFWAHGDEAGHFTIPNVRPGIYELHAIADGVFGEYARINITVNEGQIVDLGQLDWKPVRYGQQVWDIGIPNRKASEFLHGDDYFHWGWYLKYAEDFPNDVNYVIGKSDYRKDWNLEQVPHIDNDDGTGMAHGRATPWSITFDMPQAAKGKATLRLAICGVGQGEMIDVKLNGKPVAVVPPSYLPYNATINRDGVGGSWIERDVVFNASMITAGTNTIVLTIPGGQDTNNSGSATNGIMYDYLRLEVDAAAPPPPVGSVVIPAPNLQ